MTDHPNYELLQPLGAGALATVYRARDLSLQRDVAIKALKDEVRADPVRSQQLYDAAQFLAGLSHENLVQVFGLDRERGWLIMELLPGSVAQRAAQGPLPPDLVRSVLQQALRGLQALHEHKKLHGAVKPSNLLIDERGRVKVGDSAGLSLEGEVRRPEGGPKYLAPELINPEFGPVGPGVDLYGLGFTALELLKGPGFDRLFPGAGADAPDPEIGWLRLHGSRGEPVPSASRVAPNTPPDLARVVDKMLSKDVKARYSTAEEALRDLEPREILPVDLPAAGAAAAAPAPAAVTPLPGAAPAPPSYPTAGSYPAAGPASARADWKELLRRKDWKELVKKPYVLYPALGGVLLLILLLVMLFAGGGDGKLPLHVDSTPAGATVLLDGEEKKNKTPFEFHLPPGKHKVQVKLEGHEPSEEREVEVKKGAEPVAFDLRPVKGQPAAASDVAVRVTSETPGAVVYIDGAVQDRKAGEEFTLKPGKHTFQIFHDGYAPSETRTLDVQSGAGPVAFGKLTPAATTEKTVVVHIATSTPGAVVRVDGQQRGESPLDVPLGPGLHHLELSKAGFRTLAGLEFEVKSGEAPNLGVYDLTPILAGPGEEFINSVGMKLRLIPAGKFLMGSPADEPDRAPIEGPQHEVEITRPFYMGAYEVTQEQYQQVMDDNPSSTANVGPKNPVDSVSYDDAVKFCKKLSDLSDEKKAGRAYRLPTEAEWEYACRAGTKTPFNTGATLGPGDANVGGEKTTAVGSFKPNAWGLYDMHGNVWEWCADLYDSHYYEQSPAKDPTGPTRADEQKFVIRGGSWQTDAGPSRSAARARFGPKTKNSGFGFRVVAVVNAPE